MWAVKVVLGDDGMIFRFAVLRGVVSADQMRCTDFDALTAMFSWVADCCAGRMLSISVARPVGYPGELGYVIVA